jgi:hypothetical protein
MQEIPTDEVQPVVRPILGSGFVSNSWSSAMMDEGPGMIAMGILMGAFCGLVLGLLTMQVARFVSFAIGRNLGGASWALISAALGAVAFYVMMVTCDNE